MPNAFGDGSSRGFFIEDLLCELIMLACWLAISYEFGNWFAAAG